MASITGAATQATGSGTSGFSRAYTVPSDAEVVIVAIAGYDGGGVLLSELNWDDGGTLDFTKRVQSSYTPGVEIDLEIYTMDDSSVDWPGTGAKTLYFQADGNLTEGANIAIFAAKDVDTSALIVDTEGTTTAGISDHTSSLTGVGANDLTIVAANQYDPNGAPNMTPNAGQISLASYGLFNSYSLGVGYEVGESAYRVTGTEIGFAAIVLKDAGGAAANPKGALGHPINGPFGGPI